MDSACEKKHESPEMTQERLEAWDKKGRPRMTARWLGATPESGELRIEFGPNNEPMDPIARYNDYFMVQQEVQVVVPMDGEGEWATTYTSYSPG